MSSGSRQYLPSLEGIRALAFLLVFAVHLSGPTWTLVNRTHWAYPWLLACQLSFCAVPIFFALSGYLITNVLLGSLGQSGFFRVFYLRRALRVLPLYYVTLLTVFAAGAAMGTHYLWRHALLFTYLFNFWPHDGYYNLNPVLHIGHFWSLAVEEQFYLVWPLVIWFLRDRRKLLWFCFAAIAASFVGRLTWPLLHITSPEFVYQNTLYRCDAIMLGAALALYQKGDESNLQRLVRPARWALLLCSAVIVLRALAVGQAMPFDTFGVIVVMPIISLMGASIVVLTLTPGTTFERASTWRWAVVMGKRSYALYVFHQLIVPVFLDRVVPQLTDVMGRGFGRLTGMVLAFAVTCLLAEIAYRFIEEPTFRLKKHIRYGKSVATRAIVPGSPPGKSYPAPQLIA